MKIPWKFIVIFAILSCSLLFTGCTDEPSHPEYQEKTNNSVLKAKEIFNSQNYCDTKNKISIKGQFILWDMKEDREVIIPGPAGWPWSQPVYVRGFAVYDDYSDIKKYSVPTEWEDREYNSRVTVLLVQSYPTGTLGYGENYIIYTIGSYEVTPVRYEIYAIDLTSNCIMGKAIVDGTPPNKIEAKYRGVPCFGWYPNVFNWIRHLNIEN